MKACLRIAFGMLIFACFVSSAATDTVAADWRLVFEDNFDRQEVGVDWDFIKGEGKIVDGRLYICSTAGINDVSAMIVREFGTDVRLEFEAEVDPHMPPCDIAAGLGGNPFMSYGYVLQFGARNNQVNQIYAPRRDDKLLQVELDPPFHIEYGKVYRCVAAREGQRITYTVNDVKLLDVTDSEIMSGPCFGNIFLVTWNGMFVDNVKVYERVTSTVTGPTILKDPSLLDIGYHWKDRQLSYAADRSLDENIRKGIEAYNRRDYKKALSLLTEVNPPTLYSVAAAAYVLGDLAYVEKEVDQQKVALLARQVAEKNPDNQSAAAFAMLADWFSKVTIFSRDWQNNERVICVGPEHNPFYYKSLMFRARYMFAQALEQRLVRQRAEAVAIFADLQKIWPEHDGLVQLTGDQVIWGKELIRDESEGPAWARYLEEGLVRCHAIMDWWFTERQAPDGQLGGGWGDDVELLGEFGMLASISSAGQVALDGIQRVADGAWKYVLKEKGYPAGGDVEHAAEPAGNSHPIQIFLRYGDPLYVERNLQTAKFLYEEAMGVNERGGLQFKSCEFGIDGVNLHPSAVGQNMYHYVPMVHLLWLSWYGIPEARDVLVRWADNLREVAMAEIGPKPAGYMPFSLYWPSGSIYPPEGRFWLDPKAHYYGISAHKQYKYHFALYSAFFFTGDRKFLEPIDRMMDEASRAPKILPYDDSLPRDHRNNLLADFSRQNTPGISTMYRWLTGSAVYDANGLAPSMRYLIDQDLDAFAKTFEQAVVSQVEGDGSRRFDVPLRYNWAARTSEVLQTDRYGIYGDLAIFSGYTGAVTELVEDILMPTVAVTWDTPNLHFAAVVQSSSPERLRVQIYNFNKETTRIGIKPWLLVSGKYFLIDGERGGEDFRPMHWRAGRQIVYQHRGTPIYVDVPSRKTWVVDLRLLEKLDRPEHLPDLAIHSRDVRIEGNDVVVTLHNIGAAESGPFQVVFETQGGGVWSPLASVRVEGLPRIMHFNPVRRDVRLPGAGGKLSGTCRVVVDPEEKIEEICRLNNVAEFSR